MSKNQPANSQTTREMELIAAVEAWATKNESPYNEGDVDLLKALWTYRGDQPGRLSVAEAHRSLDMWLAGKAKREVGQSDELPTVAQRQVGRAWLRLYGHMVADDPAFAAAAIWRCMWLAKHEPDAPDIQHLFKEAVIHD